MHENRCLISNFLIHVICIQYADHTYWGEEEGGGLVIFALPMYDPHSEV